MCHKVVKIAIYNIYSQFYCYLRGGWPKMPSPKVVYVRQNAQPQYDHRQENLLVTLVNRRRVDGLTLPNSSGTIVCAPIMEYLVTI